MATRPNNIGVNQTRSPYMDGSGGALPPDLNFGMQFRDFGSYGLRQYSGWVREEFLQALVGREAARVYREMLDNSAIVGSMMFAITQAMRGVEWRVHAPGDSDTSTAEVKFVESLMGDMTHTWGDFVAEALSMLGYGYSVNEIVYKRRMGPSPPGSNRAFDLNARKFAPAPSPEDEQPPSQFNDGRIGWKRLPIRGQDTVLKWFFDSNGQVTGVTQQPWVGELIDIPIEKFLLFRPTAHKNNPEGKSCLRNAYRSYWFVKRLEELEAIMFERMSGFPVMSVPNSLLEQAGSNPQAAATLAAYKNLVTNVRINEQMGALIPSDVYVDAEGKPSAVRMYDFQLLTPAHGSRSVSANDTIERHKLDMLMTLLCDFVKLGHEVRGTNNLAITKVDMFYGAIEGWLTSIADVLNRYALPRLWKLNALPAATMPQFKPDMPERIDLDGLGGFIANLAKAGMPLFPDEELQAQIRGAAGLPEATSPEATAAIAQANAAGGEGGADDAIKRMIIGAVAKEIRKSRPAVQVRTTKNNREAPPFPVGSSARELEKCGWGTRGSGTHTSSGRRKPGVTDAMVAAASARADAAGGGSIAARPASAATGPESSAQTTPSQAAASSAHGLDVTHGSGGSPEFKQFVDEHLGLLSPGVKQTLAASNLKIVTAKTVVEAMPDLAGKQPQGWPPGKTWEHVDGVHGYDIATGGHKVVIAEYHKSYSGAGRLVLSGGPDRVGGVTLHETGHAYDHALVGGSYKTAFAKAYSQDVKALTSRRGLAYYLQPHGAGRQEVFAELFANAHGRRGADHRMIHEDFPRSFAHMKALVGSNHVDKALASLTDLEKCGWGTRGSSTHTSSGARKPGVTDQMVADASARARSQRAGGAGTIGGGAIAGQQAPLGPTAPAAVPKVAVTHTGATSPEFRKEIDDHLDRLTPTVKQALADHKVEIVTARNSVVEAAPHLAGVQPRGWPAGSTWENVSGVHTAGGSTSRVVVSEYQKDLTTGAMVKSYRGGRVALHESGHAYDHVKGWISDKHDFSVAHAKDVAALPVSKRAERGYFLQAGSAGRREAYAELFNQAHGGWTGMLHNDFPHSYAVVKNSIGAPTARMLERGY